VRYKSSQKKHTTEISLVVNEKFNILFPYLCVCDEKIKTADMGDKTGFVRPGGITTKIKQLLKYIPTILIDLIIIVHYLSMLFFLRCK